jgi:hypothetical protein
MVLHVPAFTQLLQILRLDIFEEVYIAQLAVEITTGFILVTFIKLNTFKSNLIALYFKNVN